MKFIIALSALLVVALAAPQATNDRDAVVLRYDNDNIGVDGYNYNVETSNGISSNEQGQLVNAGTEDEAVEVRGQYSYPGPDGIVYTVTYTAGREGFIPSGAHLPQNN